MYESEALKLSATLTGKNLLIARAQSRREESMMMTRDFSKTKAKSQVIIVTAAGLFIIYLGGPLSFV